jgi:hypothetical protein
MQHQFIAEQFAATPRDVDDRGRSIVFQSLVHPHTCSCFASSEFFDPPSTRMRELNPVNLVWDSIARARGDK